MKVKLIKKFAELISEELNYFMSRLLKLIIFQCLKLMKIDIKSGCIIGSIISELLIWCHYSFQLFCGFKTLDSHR